MWKVSWINTNGDKDSDVLPTLRAAEMILDCLEVMGCEDVKVELIDATRNSE